MKNKMIKSIVVAMTVILLVMTNVAPAMAAVSYENDRSSTTTGTSLSLNSPSGTSAGDLLLAQVAFRNDGDVGGVGVSASGWTLIDRTDNVNVGEAIYYRVATGSDTFSVSFSNAGSGFRASGGVLRYTGVDTSDPVVTSSVNTGASGNLSTNGVSAAEGERLVTFYSVRSNTSISQPSGMSERYEENDNSRSLSVSADDRAGETSGSKTASVSSSGNWVAHAVVLRDVEIRYTVTYYGNSNTGGSVPTESDTYVSGEKFTVQGNVGNLTRSGYRFAGWSTVVNGNSPKNTTNTQSHIDGGSEYAPGEQYTVGTSNVSLYAMWESTSTTYTHLDIRMNGTITIDYRINGVSQAGYPKTLHVTSSGDTATGSFVSNGVTYQIPAGSFEYSESTVDGQEWRYEPGSSRYFSWPTEVTLNMELTDDEGTIYNVSETFGQAEIMAAFVLCPTDYGFDFVMSASNISDQIAHDVTFKTTDGGTINGGTSDVTYTDLIDGSSSPTPPSTAASSGYQFLGWTKNDGTTLYTTAQVDAMTISADTVFTAQYGAEFRVRNNNGPGGDHGYIAVTYGGTTVNLDAGDQATFAYYAPYGDVSIDFVPDSGYVFLYYVIGNGAAHIDDDPELIDPGSYAGQPGANNRIDLNPKWRSTTAHLIDTTVVGGTINPGDTNVTQGEDQAFTYSPSEHYHLVSVVVDGTNVTAGNESSYTFTNVTSAHTIIVTYALDTFTVTWNNYNNVQLEQDTNVPYGTTPSYNSGTPTKPADAQYLYIFNGWSPTISPVTGDVVYTAQFAPVLRSYTVTWNNWNNVQLEQDTDVPYGTDPSYDGDEPTKPSTPQYDYTFSGWSPAVSAVEGNVTYTAQFTAVLRSYTVTWNNYDDSQLEQDTNVPFGTDPSYDGATPTKPSTAQFTYTFSGWSPVVSAVEGSVTYTAQFTAVLRSYTVTWNNYDDSQLEQDTNVPFGTDPSYDGTTPTKPSTAQFTYTFSGWSPAVSAVEGDVTYTAQFTAVLRSYTVTWNNYDDSQLEQDTNVPFGIDPSYDGTTPTKPSTAQFTYTFSGWSPAVSAVEGDVTYTAQFTPVLRSYTVTWNNYDDSQLEQDTNVPFGTDPSYDGATPTKPSTAQFTYTFSGWSPTVSSVEGDVTYTAQFTPVLRSYTVTWNNYDDSQLEQDTNVPFGTDPSYDGATPTKPSTAQYDYTFSGWSPAVSSVEGDVTYTAQFTAVLRSYTVTWNNYDDSQLEQDTNVPFGTDPSYDGATPTKPSTAQFTYTFSGWSPAVSSVEGDVTYTAQFTPVLRSYTVTWNNYDDSQLEQDTNVPFGTDPSYDGATPTKPSTAQYDYTFSGWSPTVSSVEGDVTYTAQFTAVLRSYTVTWNNYDDSQLEQDTNVPFGTDPSYDGATPTKPSTAQYDYTFSGWSPTVSAVEGDVTYTAQFTAVLRSYTVTWNNYDDSQLEQDTNVPFGTDPSYDGTTPTKPSTAQFTYTFSGWSPAVSAVEGDVTYTAQFTAVLRSYTVTWNNYDDSQLEQDTNVPFGTDPSYDGTTPTKPSTAQFTYTFSGWSPAVSSVEGDVTYTAQFTAVLRSYTVRFEDFDGTLLATDQVRYGGDAIPPANPEREGYDFTGWSPSYNNVTGNLTVVAQYKIKTFTVTFVDYDGTVIDEQTVEWNTGAVAPEAPTREGYEFAGWDVEFDAVISDLTVTALYTEIQVPEPTPGPTKIPTEEPPTTGGGGSWLWWLLLIPALGILIWLILAWLTIVPIAEAVIRNADGTMTIQWGYENRKGSKQKVEPEDSELTALSGQIIGSSATPPVEFEKGRVENAFTATAAADSAVQWKIRNRKAKVDLSKADKK